MPIARIDSGLYRELKRIQARMWKTAGVQVSLVEASRIYHARKLKSRGAKGNFQLEF